MNRRYKRPPKRGMAPAYSQKSNTKIYRDNSFTADGKPPLPSSILKACEATGLHSPHEKPPLDLVNVIEDYCEPPPEYSDSSDEEKLQHATPKEALQIHLRKMNSSIATIRQDFESVRLKVRKFDEKRFQKLDKNDQLGGGTISKLEPTWVDFRFRFEKLLFKSRETATKAVFLAQFYYEEVLQVADSSGDSLADKLQDVERFIKRVQDTEKDAGDYMTEFDELRSDLEGFTITMDQAAQDAEEHLMKEFEATSAAIKELQQKLENWSQSIIHANLAGYDEPEEHSLSAGCVSFLASIHPFAWLKSRRPRNGGSSNDPNKTISELQTELSKKEKHMATLFDDGYDLGNIKSTFKVAAIQVTEICKHLKILGAIWGVLRYDAQMLALTLENLGGQRPPSFQRSLKTCTERYKALEESLSTYAANLPPA